MQALLISIKHSTWTSALLVGAVLAFCTATNVRASEMSPQLQGKVNMAMKKLVGWAADPVVIAATKESNAKGGIAGMTNAKWDELNENDSLVKATQDSAAGNLCKKWVIENSYIVKISIFDEKVNLVASNVKTLVYNAANRGIAAAMKGEVWQSPGTIPDPATQIKSVNISAPIKDGGKVIGLINAAVAAQ